MKEKAFKREYSYFAPQSTFTRVAKKMLKEAEEVFGLHAYGEIDEVAELIKFQKDFEPVDREKKYAYSSRGDEFGSAYTLNTVNEYHISGGFDEDEYGDPIYYVDWYFFNSELYTAIIGGNKITATNHRDFMRKQTEAKGMYRYFCVHRPPSPGCIPEGAASYESYVHSHRFLGEATYDRKLTDEEVRNCGLVLDEEYERRRAYWLGNN